MSKTLILHSGALGDTILMLRVVRFLRDARGVSVHVVGRGEYGALIRAADAVSGFWSIETGGFHRLFGDSAEMPGEMRHFFGQFDVIVNMLSGTAGPLDFPTHANAAIVQIDSRPRPEFSGHITDQWLQDICRQVQELGVRRDLAFTDSAAPETMRACPRIDLDDQTRAKARAWLDGLFDKSECAAGTHPTEIDARAASAIGAMRIALLHPGSGSRSKCWPLVRVVALFNRMKIAGWKCAFLVGPVERERFSSQDMALLRATGPMIDRDDLLEVAGLLRACDCVVANDSGIAHLTAAVGGRVVAIFGPTNASLWRPLGSHVRVVRGETGLPSVQEVAEAMWEAEIRI